MSEPIHIVNPFWNAFGGSEWCAIGLYRLLEPHHPVYLWSEYEVDPALTAHAPIRSIDLSRGEYPREGILNFVGFYYDVGPWMRLSEPRRVILNVNGSNFDVFRRFAERLPATTEYVFASPLLRKRFKGRGSIQWSPIDLDRCRPMPRRDNAAFTVGKVTREHPCKHHPADPVFYRRLAAAGCDIRIMGGMLLEDELSDCSRVTLIPAGSEEIPRFMNSLDCFFFRTADHWEEPYGRVIAQAMACGLPVVCHATAGCSHHIRHGHNGFVFEHEHHAFEILMELKQDPRLRARVGAAARATAEKIYDDDYQREILAFYQR